MTELEKYQRVNSCETPTDLIQTILDLTSNNGYIQGRTRAFSGLEMAEHAKQYFKRDNVRPELMTREFGIRQQAMYIKYYTNLKS